jgi:hypothetical protein
MSRALWFCLTLWLSTFALTQEITQHTPSVPSPSSTGVEVVYVVDGTNILTYDVDPNTLNATQVGQSLKLGRPHFFPNGDVSGRSFPVHHNLRPESG